MRFPYLFSNNRGEAGRYHCFSFTQPKIIKKIYKRNNFQKYLKRYNYKKGNIKDSLKVFLKYFTAFLIRVFTIYKFSIKNKFFD